MTIRTGDLVRARESTWRVTELRSYARVRVMRLAGMEETNRARDCTLLTPFDDVERLGDAWAPRIVSRRRWMRAFGDLLVEAQPREVPLSLVGADVALPPYQLDPLLAILRGESSRVLVADEVGLGKTVQAAVLMRELRARGRGDRVLVLVPAGLRDQWRDELRDRIGVSVHMADADWQQSRARELPPDVHPWSLPGVYLASLDYIKQREVLRVLERVRWDVLVVDEAHTLAAGSERASAAGRLAERAALVVLLTATPHNGSAVDYESLRQIGALDVRGSPGADVDAGDAAHAGAGAETDGNADSEAEAEAEGDDDGAVDVGHGGSCGVAAAVGRCDPLVIFRRSRHVAGRGEARRRVHVLPLPLTSDERRMHELLDRYVQRVEQATRPGDGARLAMVVLRKRACSSAWSLGRSVMRRWRLIAEQAGSLASDGLPEQVLLPFWSRSASTEEEDGDDEPGGVLGALGLGVKRERAWLAILAEVARRAARCESKIRALSRLLRRIVRAGESVVVFTEYRDTLAHLAGRLERAFSVVQLHGGLGVEARRLALRRFGSGDARVLLTTDAAGEGLNLQRRCRVVVQVELPWNPTRVEQRIGRVDRIGQARVVHAWQFVSRGTYEERVREALSERLARIAEALRGDADVTGEPVEGAALSSGPAGAGNSGAVCVVRERVRAGESDEARSIARRLRVIRAVRAEHAVRVRDADGRCAARPRRHQVERSPPWVTIVRRAERRPFAGIAPGLICLWRVRIRSPDGALIETRIVPLHARGSARGLSLFQRIERCRDAMAPMVEVEARRICADVWARERSWHERWIARNAAIDRCMRAGLAVEEQPSLFPEFAPGAQVAADATGEWGWSLARHASAGHVAEVCDESAVEAGGGALSVERAMWLVLVLGAGV